MRVRTTLIAASIAALLALDGCGSKPAIPPYPPPPPVQPETVPLPPVSETPLLWQPGHWEWNGSNYSWETGTWIPRAGHTTMWQDGYWALKDGSWVWVHGHWQ